jgi:hypothetical protein
MDRDVMASIGRIRLQNERKKPIMVRDLVAPFGNVPRIGQVGLVMQILDIEGMLWADVQFKDPHPLHGSRMERIGLDWLFRLGDE